MEGEFPGKMWLQMDEMEGSKKTCEVFQNYSCDAIKHILYKVTCEWEHYTKQSVEEDVLWWL